MVSATGLLFARREVGLRSNPDAGAATTSLFGSHPYTRVAVTGYSSATDRADLSRREHSLRPTSGFAESARSELGRRPTPSVAAMSEHPANSNAAARSDSFSKFVQSHLSSALRKVLTAVTRGSGPLELDIYNGRR